MSGSKPRRAGSDNGNPLPGPLLRHGRLHVSAVERMLDQHQLVLPYGDRQLMDSAGAGAFAGRRANTPGKFRKAVGSQQAVGCGIPLIAVKQIVPFGDQIIQRAPGYRAFEHDAGMAERNSAIHAARRLLPLVFR